jgi:selenocysteine lyase/cysteine desulfurase
MTRLGPLLRRRDLLVRTGLVAATAAAGGVGFVAGRESGGESSSAATDLASDEGDFALDPRYTHLTSFLLAPHPRPVREAIERHRRALDENPKVYLFERELQLEGRVLEVAAGYLGVAPEEIALTDSTTMGLGLVYGTFRLDEGDEVVTTEHDHYATHESLRLRAERTGATVRRVPLYRDLSAPSEDEIVEAVRGAVGPRTRLVALTWVHSSTGLKLPVRAIADALGEENGGRDDDERVLLAVDGVHGFGVEDVPVAELGCDLFVSGCHKWLFGPRGTGLVWANEAGWSRVDAVIPTFDGRGYVAWIEGREPTDLPPAAAMTPGGFHSFEHRWALADAFAFQERWGRQRVRDHTHGLASALKEGLGRIAGVRVVTPREESLSAGIVCFELDALPAREAVDRLLAEHRVVASVTPYAVEYVRLGPSIVNGEADVERALRAVRALSPQ